MPSMARQSSTAVANARAAAPLAALLTACLLARASAFGEAPRFLIATSPSTSMVAYTKLPSTGAPATGKEEMRILVNSGLSTPQGIAVDEYRQMLYVADPSLGKLVRFPLKSSSEALAVGSMETVATDVEVRAVAVDGVGNVWFTDEAQQQVMRVTAKMIADGQTTPEIVYSAANEDEVRSPGGIALDSYFVYFVNKADGETAGSLIKGRQNPETAIVSAASVNDTSSNASSLAQVVREGKKSSLFALGYNAEKSYGVCLSHRNAFYTDSVKQVYAVPRAATARNEVVTVSMGFSEPRGCAFDGDSTLYIADKARNGVYAMASNMENLLPNRPVSLAVTLQGAFGVAVYSHLDL